MSELTKREQIAAMAMSGAMAGAQGLEISTEEFAQIGKRQADALLAALDADKPDPRDTRIAELEAALREIVKEADHPETLSFDRIANMRDVARRALKGASDE